MKDWITDYQVATEPWEYDIADRKEWNHLVCTTRSEYPTSVLKKNGEPRKSAKKSSRIICLCTTKENAELIVLEHNLNIKGTLGLKALVDVTQKAISQYIEEHSYTIKPQKESRNEPD